MSARADAEGASPASELLLFDHMATASKAKSTTKHSSHSSKKAHLAAKKPRKKKSQGSFFQRLFTSSSSEPEPKSTPAKSESSATGVTDLEPVAKALEIAKNLAHKGTELLSPSSDEKPAQKSHAKKDGSPETKRASAKPKAKSAAPKAAARARGKSSKTSHSAPRKAARPANRNSGKTAPRSKAR